MAQYLVMHECGHEVRHNIAKHSASARIESLRSSTCVECARMEEARAAAASASEQGWQAIVFGTERQIAWAETLRQRRVNEMNHAFDMLVEQYDTVRAWLISHPNAQFWIDRRYDSPLDQLFAAARAIVSDYPEPRTDDREAS